MRSLTDVDCAGPIVSCDVAGDVGGAVESRIRGTWRQCKASVVSLGQSLGPGHAS